MNASITIIGELVHRGGSGQIGIVDPLVISKQIDIEVASGATSFAFLIDSPGGTVAGVPELAEKIRSLGIPTTARISGQACSAGYWLASACDRIVASDSSEIGSIGCFIPHVDQQEAWDSTGIKWLPVVNDESKVYKTTGMGPSLTTEQRAHLQQRVEEYFALFKSFVLAGRPRINENAFDGRSFLGKQALALGLIDELDDESALASVNWNPATAKSLDVTIKALDKQIDACIGKGHFFEMNDRLKQRAYLLRKFKSAAILTKN